MGPLHGEQKNKVCEIIRSIPSRTLACSYRPLHPCVDHMMTISSSAQCSTIFVIIVCISAAKLPLQDLAVLRLLTYDSWEHTIQHAFVGDWTTLQVGHEMQMQ